MEENDFSQWPDGSATKPQPDGNVMKMENVTQVTTTSIGALQTEDSRKVMDIVDRLRSSGLSGVLQLPQLVVSGDQSSGKSSVLEAITEIPFPRKENLCTRFATEVILRRAKFASISTKIIPDKTRSSMEKKRLEDFTSIIMDFSELPTLMDEAAKVMGLGDDSVGPTRAFSRDVLSIEIAGPNRPHLTLVDLPGLIHSENKMQSREDVELIRGLVDDYIKEKRTIIMAVVSAKNDYANQIILKKCREVDPDGHRTLGIITKPDFLEPDSENEAQWISLAENHDIFFKLGWHILKNRSDKEINTSFQARNASEAAFFAKGRYRDLSRDMVGIETLRTRLSQLLYKHLKTELPALQRELNDKHREVTHELSQLGEKRATIHEQRRFLMGISSTYQDIVKAAVAGHYEHCFFGDVDPEESVDHESNLRRLRAVVQYLNLQFASAMRQHGHKLRIEDAESEPPADVNPEPELDEDYAYFSELSESIDRSEAVSRVRRFLVRFRGCELPGTFNPLLISQLFWQQSENWKTIAEFHIDKVASVCSYLVRTAVDYAVSPDVSGRMQAHKIDGALSQRLDGAKKELGCIVADSKNHPISYNPKYTATVEKIRGEKYTSKISDIMSKSGEGVEFADKIQRCAVSDVMRECMKSMSDLDMDSASAEDALDCQNAYYDEELEYFIGAVTKQVIERHLLQGLDKDTLSPVIVNDMTEDEVAFIAAEPIETTRTRDHLEARKAMLENGQKTFKSALGLFK